MTSQGYCLTCGKLTSSYFHGKTDGGPVGWFCHEGDCRASKMEPPKPDGTPISVKDAEIPKLAVKTEMTIEDQVRFEQLLDACKITLHDASTPSKPVYIVSRLTEDKLEALNLAERFEKLDAFDRLMARAFLEGMLDGIKTYRGQIGKLGPLYKKAHNVGTSLLRYIADNA